LPQARLGLVSRFVGFEVDLVVLDGPPEALDKDIVAPAAFTVHADANALRLEHPREFGAGELAALIRLKISEVP
jgi:hypothetical protein